MPQTPGSERSVASDGITFDPTNDKIRDKCVEMLYAALAVGHDIGMVLFYALNNS